VQLRRNAGKDSDLDVVDVRAKLEAARSDVERARESYGEARRALEVLIGRYPAAEIEVAAVYPALPPFAGAGIPSALLERRPDLLAAEREVLAAFRKEEARSSRCSRFLDLAGRRPLGDQVLSLLRSIHGSSRRESACRFRSTRRRAAREDRDRDRAAVASVASYGASRSRRSARSRTASRTSGCWRCNCRSTRSRSTIDAKPCGSHHSVQGRPQGPLVGGATANGAARERIELSSSCAARSAPTGATVPGPRRQLDAAPPTVTSAR
jgi:hypothetical protein